MSQSWEQLIASFEDALDHDEQALRTGNLTEVPEFAEPEGMGPIPSHLRDRVAHLISRTNLLATFVQYQLTATDADLRFERRDVKHAGAQALYLDRSV